MKGHEVTIRYGPYLSCATVQHREDPLQGLITVLTCNNHKVILDKIPDRNVIELLVHDEVVYKCFIQDLVFGGDGKLDKKCEEALVAVGIAF